MTDKQKALIKKLNKVPDFNRDENHRWADYLELMCLTHMDGIFSRNEFIDVIKEAGKELKKGSVPLETIPDITDSGSSSVYSDDDDDDDDDVADEDLVTRKAGKWEVRATDYFRQIEYRSAEFGEFYPFVVSSDLNTINLVADLTIKHKIYLFLLYCSLLNICIDYKPSLTSCFELLCVEAMKSLLPHESECGLFGSSNVHGESITRARFFEKITELAAKISHRVKIEESALSSYNKGDGGLDIYAFLKLGDKQAHTPLYFGQCACTPDWTIKQNSAKFDRWNNYIDLKVYPTTFIFIPYCFRSSNGDWHKEQAIEATVVMDRKRIIHQIKDKIGVVEALVGLTTVEEITQVKASLI